MSECPFKLHRWKGSHTDHPNYSSIMMRCEICGTGHAIELKPMPQQRMITELRVFSADEEASGQVSRNVIMWSIFAYESLVKKIEKDGYEVLRGTPMIGGRF